MFFLPLPVILLPTTTPSNQETEIDTGSYVFRDESILGTRMRVDLVARNFSDAQAAALRARNEIDRLNSILNSRAPDSELYALNRSRTHRASPELFAVVAAAEQWRTESEGAFSGRLGRVIDLWRYAQKMTPDRTPSRAELARLAHDAEGAQIGLESSTRTITRPDEVEFALDAFAKGWIIDRAFEVARSSPGISGALVNIGGDLRCGGRAPNSRGWCVGIPDARIPADNAPIVATAYLPNRAGASRAIATSGRGPRDYLIDGVRHSPTLSPRDGWPIEHTVSVTATASSAADADAIATMLLVLPKDQSIAFANRLGESARIVTNDETIVTPSDLATKAARSTDLQVRFLPVQSPKTNSTLTTASVSPSWPKDWMAFLTFTAPPRQIRRDENFRSPYMAMWVTDLDNKPIRTLLLVGTHNEWQKDNYIWWSINEEANQKLVATRSMSTSGSGVYKVLWDGTDDQGKAVFGGTYVIHIETSRERGKHTHRSLMLDFSKPEKFANEIPSTEEAGGLAINFYRP